MNEKYKKLSEKIASLTNLEKPSNSQNLETKVEALSDNYNSNMESLQMKYNTLKEQDEIKTNEKAEILKICKGSIQTLNLLSNYYKNLKKKSIDDNNNNNHNNNLNQNCNISNNTNVVHEKIDKNYLTFRNNDKKLKFLDKEKENRPKSANSNNKK